MTRGQVQEAARPRPRLRCGDVCARAAPRPPSPLPEGLRSGRGARPLANDRETRRRSWIVLDPVNVRRARDPALAARLPVWCTNSHVKEILLPRISKSRVRGIISE